MAAIVVPFGSYSIFRTADCLDDEDAGDFDEATFEAVAPVGAADFDRAGIPLLATRFAGRDDSLEGILIFSGIGVTLTILAAVFQWLELPPPYF